MNEKFTRSEQSISSPPAQAAPADYPPQSEIEAIAERLGATDPDDSLWREFAHAAIDADRVRRERVSSDYPPPSDVVSKEQAMADIEQEIQHCNTAGEGVSLARLISVRRFIEQSGRERVSADPLPDLETAKARIAELEALINTPHTDNFFEAVRLEAAHQQERWGADHDAGKEPSDWFWLLGYLSGKALAAFGKGDKDKGLHHIISSAASLLNWHRNVTGEVTAMRPGILPPASQHQVKKGEPS